MAKKVSTINEYIANAEEFAQPILNELRANVHLACPEVEEVIKWNFPNFLYRNQILCSMAAFKGHCAFTFWLGDQLKDELGLLNPVGKSGMGQLGKLKSVNEIPSKEKLIHTLREAMALTESGVRIKKRRLSGDQPVGTKDGKFEQLLKDAKQARTFFNELSPSQQREYVNWIDEAKTEVTKEKRITQSLEWLGEKKVRNWKYLKK